MREAQKGAAAPFILYLAARSADFFRDFYNEIRYFLTEKRMYAMTALYLLQRDWICSRAATLRGRTS